MSHWGPQIAPVLAFVASQPSVGSGLVASAVSRDKCHSCLSATIDADGGVDFMPTAQTTNPCYAVTVNPIYSVTTANEHP